jgi:DNA polymerase-1
VRTLGERLAVNTVIQGTAADVMKLGMVRVADALRSEGLKTRMTLTIHDELLFEGPPEEMERVAEIAREGMVSPWGDREPPLAVDVGVGRTWLEAK